MSQIKGKNTKPEVIVRQKLFQNGCRGYRIHSKLIGKPDIVFTKKKTAVFIDGCYWHKCSSCFVRPKTRTKWWMKKIEGNVKRDKEVNKILKKDGWKVLRFWEHEVRRNPDKVSKKIIAEIKKRGLDDNKNT